jgi:short-subunit dehydrogenase
MQTGVIQGALITGASGGIGRAFAQALAAKHTNLILVARSQAKLEELATTLTSKFQIKTLVIAIDLASEGATRQVYEQVRAASWQVDLLINNAGVGDYGDFAERSLVRQQAIIQLNVLAFIELTHYFLPLMREQKQGVIMNISSITAFQPIPYLSTYAATKAFIAHFSRSLWAENRRFGIRVLVVCPGPTETEFFHAAEMSSHTELMAKQTYETAESVVAEALAALAKGKSLVVTTGGRQNRLIEIAAKFTPQRLLLRILEAQFRPPKPESSKS